MPTGDSKDHMGQYRRRPGGYLRPGMQFDRPMNGSTQAGCVDICRDFPEQLAGRVGLDALSGTLNASSASVLYYPPDLGHLNSHREGLCPRRIHSIDRHAYQPVQ